MYMTFESGLPAHEWCADVKSQCDEREFSRTFVRWVKLGRCRNIYSELYLSTRLNQEVTLM